MDQSDQIPARAYITLLTKPLYLPGILVLDQSLRSVGSRYPLIVMVTPSLPEDARSVLRRRGVSMKDIQSLHPISTSGEALFEDRFADTWTKLRAFELFGFHRIVLLDCDMLIKRNMDDLFDFEMADGQIAATFVCACNPRKLKHYPADWVPENCAYSSYSEIMASPTLRLPNAPRPHGLLNSGTVVINPSKKLADDLFAFFLTNNKLLTYKFPDQDLLSDFCGRTWKPIPWYYNALRTLRSIHPDVWDDGQVRCIHYIFSDKPWFSRRNPDVNVKHFGILHDWWWQEFDRLSHAMKLTDPEGWSLVLKQVDVCK